jgi:hypothetical protein
MRRIVDMANGYACENSLGHSVNAMIISALCCVVLLHTLCCAMLLCAVPCCPMLFYAALPCRYSGSDLAELCREAARLGVRRVAPSEFLTIDASHVRCCAGAMWRVHPSLCTAMRWRAMRLCSMRPMALT